MSIAKGVALITGSAQGIGRNYSSFRFLDLVILNEKLLYAFASRPDFILCKTHS